MPNPANPNIPKIPIQTVAKAVESTQEAEMPNNTVRARYVDGLLELVDPLPAATASEVRVVLDSGEPIDPDDARERMARAAGSWQKYFDEDPSLMDLYRQCSCCPSTASDR